ncbi:MAG: hypothetical protein ACTSU2_08060 [Promethearchaeota archaeon]
MNDTMHATTSFLVYYLIYYLWFHTLAPLAAGFFSIIFGLLPDFDGIYWSIKNKGKEMGMNFQHHLYSWFHWPIRWTPLILVFIIALVFNFYPQYFLIPPLGVYVHMVGDSISCGDGMMWGHGWKRTDFARYINLWSSKTDGYHGKYWNARYKKTIFYKLEIIFGFIVIGIVIYSEYGLIIDNGMKAIDIWGILIIFYILGSIIVTATMDLSEYEKEPPEGRYADYRKNPEYLAWLEKKRKKKQNKPKRKET